MTASVPEVERMRFPALDAVRALGATAVVGTHVGFYTGRTADGPFSWTIARLDVGVALFFVLSGFLLFRPYAVAAATAGPRPRTGRYLWRRALRILPAYWLVAILCLLLLQPLDGTRGVGDWVRHLTLTQIYGLGLGYHGLTQTWSLCTEVSFYLVLPALASVVLLRRGTGWALGVLVALCAIGVAWSPVLNATGILDVRIAGQWLPAYVDWFAGGMALALVQTRLAAGLVGRTSPLRVLEDLAHSAGTCWAAALAVFALATSPLAGPVTFRDAGAVPPAWGLVCKNVLYLLVALLVVLPLVLGPQDQGVLRRVLTSRPLQRLGEISYGIFLWHLLVLDGVTRLRHQQLFTGSWVVLMALTWSATVLVAWASYRWLERPVMRWRREAPVVLPRPRTSVDHATTSPVAQSA